MLARKKLVESERSPAMVMSAWKQKQMLQKEHKMLDNQCDLVVGRITLNQRIAFKRFKHKLQCSKLAHAKIMGDKEAVKEIRASARTEVLNTNFGLDPADEEVLEKIWQASKNTKEKLLLRDTLKSANILKSSSTVEDKPKADTPPARVQLQRPKTSPQARFISTGHGAVHEKSAQDGGDADDDTASIRTFTSSEESAKKTKKIRQQRPISAPAAGNIFSNGEEGPSLLDLHRERIKSAGYEDRVQGLCRQMETYKVNKDYLIPDYYKFCRDAEADPLTRNSARIRSAPLQESNHEFQKYIGNPHVKSLTLKPLVIDGAPWVNQKLLDALPNYHQPTLKKPPIRAAWRLTQ